MLQLGTVQVDGKCLSVFIFDFRSVQFESTILKNRLNVPLTMEMPI